MAASLLDHLRQRLEREGALTVADFMDADEIFSTGNHSKVVPIVQIEDRRLQPGPIATKARELYWEWAHA